MDDIRNSQTANEATGGASAVDRRVSRLVDRFLAWPLPDSVASDQCATMPGYPHRCGTNLLTAVEARQMIEYLLGDALDRNAATEEEGDAYMVGWFDGRDDAANARNEGPAL